MFKSVFRLLLVAAALGLAAMLPAQTNLIVNPSFEYFTAAAPVNTTIYPTSTFVQYTVATATLGNSVPVGWENYAGAMQDIISTNYGAGAFPAAISGLVAGGVSGNDQMTQNTTHTNSYYLYLGDSAQSSTIRQTGLSLTGGTTYTLSFQLAPLIFGGAPDAKVTVQLISASNTDNFTPATFIATAGGGWQTQTYSFTPATTQSYSLYFTSFTGFNTIMDNVSLTAVPEPSTYAALLGVGALGVTLWRRRRSGATT